MHQDLLQFQTCQTPWWPKTQVPKSRCFEITLIDVLGHINWKLPIFRKHFWAIIFLLTVMAWTTFEPKANPFKMVLIGEEMLQLRRPSMACIVTRIRQIVKKKERTKEKLIVMSCTWKIRLFLNENQESQIQEKMWKKWQKKKEIT